MENNTNQQESSNDNTVKNDSTQAVNKNENQIPISRFNEVNSVKKELADENASLKARISEIEQKQKDARNTELEKQGEYKKLLDEQKKVNVDVQQKYDTLNSEWTGYKEEKTKEFMDMIPEDKREFADGMPFLKLEKFANSFQATPNAPKTNTQRPANTGGDFGGYSSYVEWAQKDPESYEKANQDINKNGGIKLGFE